MLTPGQLGDLRTATSFGDWLERCVTGFAKNTKVFAEQAQINPQTIYKALKKAPDTSRADGRNNAEQLVAAVTDAAKKNGWDEATVAELQAQGEQFAGLDNKHATISWSGPIETEAGVGAITVNTLRSEVSGAEPTIPIGQRPHYLNDYLCENRVNFSEAIRRRLFAEVARREDYFFNRWKNGRETLNRQRVDALVAFFRASSDDLCQPFRGTDNLPLQDILQQALYYTTHNNVRRIVDALIVPSPNGIPILVDLKYKADSRRWDQIMHDVPDQIGYLRSHPSRDRRLVWIDPGHMIDAVERWHLNPKRCLEVLLLPNPRKREDIKMYALVRDGEPRVVTEPERRSLCVEYWMLVNSLVWGDSGTRQELAEAYRQGAVWLANRLNVGLYGNNNVFADGVGKDDQPEYVPGSLRRMN